MNWSNFSLVCFVLLLVRNSFEETNSSNKKKKKHGIEDVSKCPKLCKCSTIVTQHSDFVLHHLPKVLRTVNCTSAKMKKLPSQIPSNTQSLIMVNNVIKDLHQVLPELTELISLDLSGNKIQNLGRGMIFRRLKKLKLLTLSENSFKILFAKVFAGLSSLEKLEIRNTRLSYIDEYALERLNHLTYLCLSGNQLVNIFLEWFEDMNSLQVLDLSKNHITFVSANSFSYLSSLLELNLQGNNIKGLSDTSLNGLSFLKTLKLSENNLEKVPTTAMNSLNRLSNLDLSSNPIHKLSEFDLSNKTLIIVKLNNMAKLQLISSRAFSFLPNITAIELNNNAKLTYIDALAFNKVNKHMEMLQMRHCGLKTIFQDMMKDFGPETILDISGNNFSCDCNIKWLLNSSHPIKGASILISNSSILRCSSPLDFDGLTFNELDSANISDTCPAETIIFDGLIKKVATRRPMALECRATGIPSPDIVWVLPNGQKLNSTYSLGRIRMETGGGLRFDYITKRDSGEYVCMAFNTLGNSSGHVNVSVIPIDLGIHINRISATFVTVVWNGTARNSYTVYKLLLKEKMVKSKKNEVATNEFIVIPISPFERYYTISKLQPSRVYIVCIAVEDGLPPKRLDDQIVACVNVSTSDVSLILSQMSRGHSNVAIGISLGITVLSVIVLSFALMAAKKYRHRKYKDPDDEKNEISNNVSQIQLETLYSPLIASSAQP